MNIFRVAGDVPIHDGIRVRHRRGAATDRPGPVEFHGRRGDDVVDPTHRLIGTISDVVYGDDGAAQWAVVDVGLVRSSHYLPVTSGSMSESGEFVVPFDKRTVKASPLAERTHVVDAALRAELDRHYELN